MHEVVPSDLGGDECSRDVTAGVIVGGKKQILFGGRWSPLVVGGGVLISFADRCPAEPALGGRPMDHEFRSGGAIVRLWVVVRRDEVDFEYSAVDICGWEVR
jgi:hypothetical protein